MNKNEIHVVIKNLISQKERNCIVRDMCEIIKNDFLEALSCRGSNEERINRGIEVIYLTFKILEQKNKIIQGSKAEIIKDKVNMVLITFKPTILNVFNKRYIYIINYRLKFKFKSV